MIDIDLIKSKSKRCLSCIKKPCMNGCPLNNDIGGFIKLVKEEKFLDAYMLLNKTTVLGSICGRICPHYEQCMGSCILGYKSDPVDIGYLEYNVSDMGLISEWSNDIDDSLKGKNILVIGSGPSGLTVTSFLKRMGASITIYEKHNYIGGLLKHGIPEFRLNRDILDRVIDNICSDVDIKFNMELGVNFNIEDVYDKFDAIYIGVGANISSNMNIIGNDLKGVYGANELLEYNSHPDYTNKKVIVSGGGNVAMDISRTIKRLGGDVTVIYRRSESEMPASKKEIEEAKIEGIKFLFLNNIVKVLGKRCVTGVECVKTELVKKDNDDRLSPINIEGSNYNIKCNYVVMAIGSHSDSKIINNKYYDIDKYGNIVIDNNGRCRDKKIFAGGDVAGIKKTVAWASRSGRNSAYAIRDYLLGVDSSEESSK